MSRKTKKKSKATSAGQASKPARPRDNVCDFADNLIFSGTLLVLFLRPFISGRTYPVQNHFFNIAIALITLLWVLKSWRKGVMELHNRLLTGFILGFLAVCSFAFFTTADKGITIRYIYEILTYSFLFLILANNFRDRSSILAVAIVLMAAGIFINVYGLAQLMYTLDMTRQYVTDALKAGNQAALSGVPIGSGILHRLESPRIFSTFLHPGSYAVYLVMLGALSIGWVWNVFDRLREFARNSIRLVIRKPSLKAESVSSLFKGIGGILLLILLLTSCLLIPVCLWLTYSRGGLLSAIVVVITFIAMAMVGRKAPKETVAVAAVALIVLASVIQAQNVFGANLIPVKDVSFLSRLKDSQTVQQRITYWKAALAMFTDNPWFGVGWGAFESAYPRYMILGGYPVKLAHNNFLQVAAETGLLGLNLYVGIWLVAIYTFWRKSTLTSKTKLKGIACGLGAAIIAFLVNSLVDFALYLPEVVTLVFACLGALAAVPAGDEKDKFSIPLKTPAAVVLLVFLVCFLILVGRSCIALNIYTKVEEAHAKAFPNSFSIERGVKVDPRVQYQTLKASIPELEKSISYFPSSSAPYYSMGISYLRLAGMENDPLLLDDAIKCLERASELNPLSPYIHDSLAIAYWKQAIIDQKQESFQRALLSELKAVRNFPVYPNFRKQLSQIYTALGDEEQAKKEKAQAAELAKHYREF